MHRHHGGATPASSYVFFVAPDSSSRRHLVGRPVPERLPSYGSASSASRICRPACRSSRSGARAGWRPRRCTSARSYPALSDEDPVEGLRSLRMSRVGRSTRRFRSVHVIAEYTEEDRERLKRVDAVSENGIDVYDEVVLPSESLLQLARNTLVGFGHGVAAADLELTFVGRVRSTTCKGTTMATGKCDATIVTHFIADHSA